MPIEEIRERLKDKLPRIDLNDPNTNRAISGGGFVIGGALKALYSFFELVTKALIDLLKSIRW